MGEVVGFQPAPKASDYLWRCDCGCLSFALKADMTAECQHCGAVPYDENGSWRSELPIPPETVEPCEPTDFRVTDMHSSGAALERCLSKADAEKTAFVAVVQNDGSVSTWGEAIEGPKHKAWLKRRLDEVRRLMVKE